MLRIAGADMKRAALGAAVAMLLLVPATSLEAATVRGHSTTRHHHGGGHPHHGGGYHYPYYYPYYYPYSYGYPYYGFSVGFAAYGYPYGYPYGYAPGYAYGGAYPAAAFVDTDISPEEAQVYLDGEYVGTADDFDGFPTYLPIEAGKHELTFKLEGFRSVTKQIDAPARAVLSFDFRLPEGTGGEADESPGGQGNAGSAYEGESEVALQNAEEVGPGFVALKVTPPDASVYLDGVFLGSADVVSRLHGNLRVESGKHRIEVVRPGHKAASKEITVKAGERLTVSIDLKESDTD